MSEHQKIIQDLSDRLEEALRTVQMLKEEKESMMDQLEAAKTLSEVGNVYLSLNTKYEEFVLIFLHHKTSFGWAFLLSVGLTKLLPRAILNVFDIHTEIYCLLRSMCKKRQLYNPMFMNI